MKQEVVNFINDFCNKNGNPRAIERQFANGYCYHFALILKNVFNRGEICLAYPYGHIIWKDTDGTAYDIYGEEGSEYEYLIPIKYMGKFIDNFIRTDSANKTKGATKEDIEEIKNKFLKENKALWK